MTRPPYLERINAAHERGHLFAHMFESCLEKEGTRSSLGDLFNVMACKRGASYVNRYHNYLVSLKHGALGLAATALKADAPAKLYTDWSSVGLLMDSAKPLVVSNVDSYTKLRNNEIEIDLSATDKKLCDLQELPRSVSNFNLSQDTAQRVTRAEKALAALWTLAGQNGNKLNEINIAARLQDVCGLVVHKHELGHPKRYATYAESVRAAARLKQYLIEHYPGQFDTSLPILSYEVVISPDGSKLLPKLTALTPQHIENILVTSGLALPTQSPGEQIGTVSPAHGKSSHGLGGGA